MDIKLLLPEWTQKHITYVMKLECVHKVRIIKVFVHMDFHQHKLDIDNIKILDRESRWFQRDIKEALQICTRSPSLNRERG